MKYKAVFIATSALAVAVMLAACSSPAASPSPTSTAIAPATVTVGFDNPLAYTNNMPIVIAINEGFFDKQKLTVKTVAFSGGSTATRAVVSGSADVQAGVGFDQVGSSANNLGTKIFYTVARDSDFALYGSKAANVGKPKDLVGKTLAASAFGSYSDFLARSTGPAIGVKSDAIKREALGTNPALFGALANGSAAGTWNPAGIASLINGTTIVGTTTSLKITTQYSSLIAKTSWLTANPSVARRFALAVQEAITWHNSHKAAAVALAEKELKLPAAAAEASYDAAKKIFTTDGKVSVPGLQAMAKAVPTLGLGSSAPAVSGMYTNAYLPAK